VVQFHTKPLSSFVMISFLLSGAAGYVAYTASSGDPLCEFKKGAMFDLSTFCYVIMAVAFVNIVFALYFQRQVWKQIKTLIQKDYEDNQNNEATLEMQQESYASKANGLLAQGRAQFGAEAEEQKEADEEAAEEVTYRVLAKVVQEGFKKTFLEDFGVLIFFLASIGIVIVSHVAKNEVADSTAVNCQAKDEEGWTCTFGFGFFILPAIYTFLWYCCACCAKAVPISGKDLLELQKTSTGAE